MDKIKYNWNRFCSHIPTEKLRRWWKKVPKAIRVPLVLIIGIAVMATGIAMLILPGPGWAAIFLGLAILASEFAAVEKVRDWLIDQVKQLYHYSKKRYQERKNKRQA